MTHVRRTRARVTWRRSVAAASVALALALTGCAQMPTAGPVERGDVMVTELGPIYLQVYGPPLDARPSEIVQGFLGAQAAGLYDDWATAREYLSTQAADAWSPGTSTIVYSGEASFAMTSGPQDPDTAPEGATDGTTSAPTDVTTTDAEPTDAAVVQGRVAVVATLDEAGRYTEAPVDATEDVTFELALDDDGQWRITNVEDVTYVSVPNFLSVYRATTLYFPTTDGAYLVPEVRWYSKSSTATFAVNGVLAGPSEWLRDSVRTVAPEGTSLVVDAVTVDERGVARVDLTRDVLAADAGARTMLQAQLDAVLLRLPQVRSVEIFAASVPLAVGGVATPVRDPIPAAAPWVLAGDVVSRVQGRTVEPVDGLASLAGLDPTALALAPSGETGVFRSGRTAIATLPTVGNAPVTLASGVDLLAPSIDRFGWTWTGERSPGAGLRAVAPDGTQVAVAADWLAGRTIESVRVAHEGARVVVVSTAAGTTTIDVAAVVRDDSDVPQSLSVSVPVGAGVPDATQVVWIDESTVGVLARGASSSAPTVHVVPLSGRSETLSPVDGTTSIAAGRGLRSLYVATDDGELLSRASTGATWSPAADGVRLPAFPG